MIKTFLTLRCIFFWTFFTHNCKPPAHSILALSGGVFNVIHKSTQLNMYIYPSPSLFLSLESQRWILVLPFPLTGCFCPVFGELLTMVSHSLNQRASLHRQNKGDFRFKILSRSKNQQGFKENGKEEKIKQKKQRQHI